MHRFPNRDKWIKMLLILAGILLLAALLNFLRKSSSLTLSDYALQHSGQYDSEDAGHLP